MNWPPQIVMDLRFDVLHGESPQLKSRKWNMSVAGIWTTGFRRVCDESGIACSEITVPYNSGEETLETAKSPDAQTVQYSRHQLLVVTDATTSRKAS
jgi:hypothetical protein